MYPNDEDTSFQLDKYDNEVLETEDLIIPHVEMHKRDFVLKPLAEIAPNKRHPILGKTIGELAAQLSK